MARLKDVAQLAQVSVSVASRVLNNDEGARINADTRKRVFEAAEQLAYVPDHRARALRLARAGAIALVVPEVNNAIFANLHAGVQEICHESSTAVFVAQLDPPEDDSRSLARIIGNGRVDGVILQRSEQYSDEALRRAIQLDIPVVLFNSTLEGHVGSVAMDDAGSVNVALEHLRGLGHTDIAFIAGAAQHDAAARRLVAFRELLGASGAPVRDEWIVPAGWEAPAGAEAMRSLLELPERPTAVLVASVNASIGALSAALAAGVRVPEELSIVTIHDTWQAEYVTPSITTVAMPMHAAGQWAASMVLDHLSGSPLRDEVITSPAPRLVVRSSTSAPRR
ncbi:LacI family DNA-binding transcriptional regulator [Salinibacterium soli]|uniref:LacI family DNA-binding transcriptional regulator n=1 Tax=Antiquaquibacter soli TaxID=3064523 RepID=A0ABT9BLS2_9MICO|nr:LacI family DNA-binding transcriptional regulator [Protaetiibacter sp. WY-16]MDO7881924.1 LacI family DNA-binding transcriptional regulator [Protaetiibacter sp. WY-16]